MDRLGLKYELRDVTTDDEARATVELLSQTLGRQIPIVTAGDESWSGFQPDRIKALEGVA